MGVELLSESTESGSESLEALLGVDLTVLGVSDTSDLMPDLPEHADLSMIASCINAAANGGLDFAYLTEEFRARSDNSCRALDALRTMARLATSGELLLRAGMPGSLEAFSEAERLLSNVDASVEVDIEGDVSELAELVARAHTAGLRVSGKVSEDAWRKMDFAASFPFLDSLHLCTTLQGSGRELKRKLARAGLDIPVLMDLGVIISGSLQAAHERALLIEGMNGGTLFPGIARCIGTVYDVADKVEAWIGGGYIDGVIFVPASLPTDLASIIRGVIPLLKARGLN